MSQENLQRLLRAMEAEPSPESLDAFLAICDPGVVWDMSRSPFPDAQVFHGVEGVKHWFAGLRDAFGEPSGGSFRVEKAHDAGDRIVLMQRAKVRGQSTGIAVEYGFAGVYTFRASKVVRFDRYDDWAQALAAVGLAE